MPDILTVVRPNLTVSALRVAIGQIGQMENPLNSNRGVMIDEYHRSIGLDPDDGNPWCMAFVYYCFKIASELAGVSNPAIKSAHCLTVWDKANDLESPKQTTAKQAKANWKLVKPGQIFILEIARYTRAGHTGFVESVNYNTGIMTTIEGNSNENGSREGLGVYRLRRRKVSSINVGFIEYT